MLEDKKFERTKIVSTHANAKKVFAKKSDNEPATGLIFDVEAPITRQDNGMKLLNSLKGPAQQTYFSH